MEIKIETGGQRLDKALSDLTELSRSLANEQIKAGQVLVNGQVKKAKYTVQEGDVVTYHVPEPEVLEYVAEDLPLEIIYQDEDVAVVNKPQGMVVHPSAGMNYHTLRLVIPVEPWSMPSCTISRICQVSMGFSAQELFTALTRTRLVFS